MNRLPLNKFAKDHCHKTGIERALICRKCNSGLGFFGDSPPTLRRAAKYIEEHARAHKVKISRAKWATWRSLHETRDYAHVFDQYDAYHPRA